MINRLLHPLINTAAMLVEEGVASVEVVDGLLEGCLGIRPARCARGT